MKTLHLSIIAIIFVIGLSFSTVLAQTITTTLAQTTMKKILDVKEFEKFAESSLNKTILWSYGGSQIQFASFFWTPDSKSIIFRVDDVDALWSINPDGTNLKRINETDMVLKAINQPYNQLGNIEVNTNPCPECPSRGLTLQTVNGTYRQDLHTENTDPVAPAISPDGNFIVFGSNADPWNSEQDRGIYLLVLSSSIPEFPFAVPVLLASITLLIVFYRTKFRLF